MLWTWVIGFVVGLVLWTLLEYVLHRWLFHRRVLGRLPAREHLMHHARVDYFTSFGRKLLIAVPVLSPIVLLSTLSMGVELGVSVPIGVLAGWTFYEILHQRIHLRRPLGRYGLWARRHHLLHHFGRSDANHGVTSPVWDVVFGTLAEPETIKVPRQHAAKFPWLLEAGGAPRVSSTYADEYRIV